MVMRDGPNPPCFVGTPGREVHFGCVAELLWIRYSSQLHCKDIWATRRTKLREIGSNVTAIMRRKAPFQDIVQNQLGYRRAFGKAYRLSLFNGQVWTSWTIVGS